MDNLGARRKALKAMIKQAKPKLKKTATPAVPDTDETSYQGSAPAPRGTLA